MGTLPVERVTPGQVFEDVGVDYAGPVYVKYGFVRRLVIVKTDICVCVSLSIKAIHLKLVSELTSEAFIASLRRFNARHSRPRTMWSDHGTNFIGANREIKEMVIFLKQQQVRERESQFCSDEGINWKFMPECALHFGGLWEAAVKSMKSHLRRVVGDNKLTFEEYTTLLTQVESCLNSRPLVPLSNGNDEQCEALTPVHFLIGKPLESLPDPSSSFQPMSMLRRWHLVQSMVQHFWAQLSKEYPYPL